MLVPRRVGHLSLSFAIKVKCTVITLGLQPIEINTSSSARTVQFSKQNMELSSRHLQNIDFSTIQEGETRTKNLSTVDPVKL